MGNMPRPARRMEEIQTPIMPIVAGWIRDNPGTITLGQGVVSYSPPPEVLSQVKAFGATLDEHRYQSVAGIPELLAQIENKLVTENATCLSEREIVVTAGANMAFLTAILAITDPEDEIILLRPYYFNHEMAIRIIGCQPVLVDTDEVYQPCMELLRKAINQRTRAIVTVSPNNPTGAVYVPSVLEEINTLCAEHRIYHISDEAYEYFVYEGTQHFSPASLARSSGHTISLYSLSKAYGFASWRIGYMVIPALIYDSVIKVQDTNLICAPVVSQQAAVKVLEIGRAYCDAKIRALGEIRARALATLSELKDVVTVPPAQGAFYLFLRLHQLMDTPFDALQVTRYLIEKHRIAVVPGDAFGPVNGCYLRVSYGALDKETVHEGIARLVNGLRQLPLA